MDGFRPQPARAPPRRHVPGHLAVAIDAFLSQPDLAATTRAKYRQTLAVVEGEIGDAPVTRAGLAGVVAQRWS